jgi:hypothetical protein
MPKPDLDAREIRRNSIVAVAAGALEANLVLLGDSLAAAGNVHELFLRGFWP